MSPLSTVWTVGEYFRSCRTRLSGQERRCCEESDAFPGSCPSAETTAGPWTRAEAQDDARQSTRKTRGLLRVLTDLDFFDAGRYGRVGMSPRVLWWPVASLPQRRRARICCEARASLPSGAR